MEYVRIFITAPSRDEAERVGKDILDKKLIACFQLVAPITSAYWWKGRQETAEECLLLCTSVAPLVSPIVRAVKALHSYEVPEIISVPITGGNPDYLSWIRSSVSVPDKEQ